MANVLVVANDTHGGHSLIEAIKARAAAGRCELRRDRAAEQAAVRPRDLRRGGARRRADTASRATLAALRELGIEARGDVMDPDPFNATLDAVREYGIDEIIVSTHPETRSGWMRRDLIERVQEATGLPVQHVVVDLDADRAEATQTLVIANQTAGGEPLFEELKRRAADGPPPLHGDRAAGRRRGPPRGRGARAPEGAARAAAQRGHPGDGRHRRPRSRTPR